MNAGGRFGLLHPWDTFVREVRIRYLTEFGLGAHSAGHESPFVRLKAVALIAYLVGIFGCLLSPSVRRRPEFRIILPLTGIHFAYMAFFENMKFSFYLVHLLPLYCVTLAIFSVTVWRKGSAPKWVVAGALGLLMTIAVAGIAAKIRIDDYGTSYMPAVKFVRQHASPSDLVDASCSFGFGYGFDRNLLDDATLGYYNGREPQYIVVEEIYDEWWHEIEAPQAAVYRHVVNTLGKYDLVYDHANYRVYARRKPG